MTPDSVTNFLREYGNYDISGAEPLKVAHAAFYDDWAPTEGYKNDPLWVPPYWMADEVTMAEHNKVVGIEDAGTITTGDDLYEGVSRIGARGSGFPIPNIELKGKGINECGTLEWERVFCLKTLKEMNLVTMIGLATQCFKYQKALVMKNGII